MKCEKVIKSPQDTLFYRSFQIQQVTEEMSRVLSQAGHLPSAAGFSAMKDDLSFKQGEMEKSKNTLDGLGKEHGQLQMNLEKVDMEFKLTN